MTRLHMQTEQVLAVARKFAQTAQEIETQAEQVGQRVRGIPWEGPGREEYVARVNQLIRQIQQKAQEGMTLSQRVTREAEEWLEVDARFADGLHSAASRQNGTLQGNFAAPGKDYELPPRDVQDLVAYTMDGDGQPIKIIKIGENKYLVVLRGTKGGDRGENWGSAYTTGWGLPSDYQRQVEKAIRENIPAGAEINFSGHSQGGIVANNLADDQDILMNYKIGDVYTFGSPSSGRDGENYHRFAAQGDPVPYLDRHAILPALGAGILGTMLGPSLLGSLFGPRAFVDTLSESLTASVGKQTGITGARDPISSHLVYPDSDELRNMKFEATNTDHMSFEEWDTTWNTEHGGQYQFGTQAESSLSLIEADMMSGDPLRIMDGVRSAPREFVKITALGVANSVATPLIDQLPDNLRNSVDGYLERFNEFAVTSRLF